MHRYQQNKGSQPLLYKAILPHKIIKCNDFQTQVIMKCAYHANESYKYRQAVI